MRRKTAQYLLKAEALYNTYLVASETPEKSEQVSGLLVLQKLLSKKLIHVVGDQVHVVVPLNKRPKTMIQRKNHNYLIEQFNSI